MALNFPDSPSVNDIFTSGDRSWIWDGTTWKITPLSVTVDTLIKSATVDSIVTLTQAEYDALTPDTNVIYLITE